MPRPTRSRATRAIATSTPSLVRVDVRPDADREGETFAEFEYGLAPEDVDARLVAIIDISREIVDVRHDA